MGKGPFSGEKGLLLSRRALRALRDAGIFAHSLISVQHQDLAKRYVLRGLESGGALGDTGRYVTFAGTQGEAIEYLHPVEAIARNGLHAVVIAPVLVRADMLRKGRTYELLVTRHSLSLTSNGQRPRLESTILFRGIHGRLELDLTGKDKTKGGSVAPTFYSLAGEEIVIPTHLHGLVRAATRGATCIACTHAHYLRKPRATTSAPVASPTVVPTAKGIAGDLGGSDPALNDVASEPERTGAPLAAIDAMAS